MSHILNVLNLWEYPWVKSFGLPNKLLKFSGTRRMLKVSVIRSLGQFWRNLNICSILCMNYIFVQWKWDLGKLWVRKRELYHLPPIPPPPPLGLSLVGRSWGFLPWKGFKIYVLGNMSCPFFFNVGCST